MKEQENDETEGAATHRIQSTTSEYNARRYSRPWIAVVDYGQGGKPKYTFGHWIGEHDGGTGSAGVLTISAKAGDIIGEGQKDFRGNSGWSNYGVVQEDGRVAWCDSKAAAYQRALKQIATREMAPSVTTTEVP